MDLKWQPKAILIAGGSVILLVIFLVAFPLYLLNEADRERRRRMSEPARARRWKDDPEVKPQPEVKPEPKTEPQPEVKPVIQPTPVYEVVKNS